MGRYLGISAHIIWDTFSLPLPLSPSPPTSKQMKQEALNQSPTMLVPLSQTSRLHNMRNLSFKPPSLWNLVIIHSKLIETESDFLRSITLSFFFFFFHSCYERNYLLYSEMKVLTYYALKWEYFFSGTVFTYILNQCFEKLLGIPIP